MNYELVGVERINSDGTVTRFVGFTGLKKGDRFRIDEHRPENIYTAASDPHPCERNPSVLCIATETHGEIGSVRLALG